LYGAAISPELWRTLSEAIVWFLDLFIYSKNSLLPAKIAYSHSVFLPLISDPSKGEGDISLTPQDHALCWKLHMYQHINHQTYFMMKVLFFFTLTVLCPLK
jgi:hypothetical protein